MLQTMRHLAHSWVFKALMLFLVISFGIWGIGDIFRGNPLQRTVAKSGKVAITVQKLDQTFDGALVRARRAFGPELTAQQAKQIGIYDQTLDSLIDLAGIEQDVDRLGLNISDRTMLEKIEAQPQFRDKDGHFDKTMFHQVVAQSGLSEQSFMETGRKEMARQQLFDSIRSGAKIPQTMIDNVYRARGQKRILDVVTIKNSGFADIPAPDDKALHDYYDQNAAKLMAPEYRGLTIARLSTDDIAKDITVSDADLKKEYDLKASDLTHPERRDLLQVVLQDEGKAKQLAAAARQSHDLAAAAKKAGYDPVPLDEADAKTTLPELGGVFSLGAGQVSDPVKSSLGWHVVQVRKIIPAGTPDFESVKDQLRESVKHDRAIENVTRIVNELDDQLAAGHALEDIADGMKLRLIKIPALDATGKTPDGSAPAELPDRDNVLKAVFSQGSGESSPILDDREGNYTVVRTDEITPAAEPPFDKIKDRVIAAWKASEQAKRASAAADDIAKSMREGKPASSFAAQAGVDVRVSKPVSLAGDSDPDLPKTVLPQVLKMKKGEVVAMPLPDRQLVLRLAELVDVDPAAGGLGVNDTANQLNAQVPDELVREYIKYLRVLFPVDIDQNLLDSLRQQGS